MPFDNASKEISKVLLKQVANYIAPLFFESISDQPKSKINNGTIFFCSTGTKILGVTAYHVYKEYLNAKKNKSLITSQIGNTKVENLEKFYIDGDEKIDIATFEINVKTIKNIGKKILNGSQKTWPPEQPKIGDTVFFAGYPGQERIASAATINFGIYGAIPIIKTINNNDLVCQFEREYMIDLSGKGLPDENYKFGGLSGAPIIAIDKNESGILTWRLAGIIHEANSEYQIICARRCDFIFPDGKLNKEMFI